MIGQPQSKLEVTESVSHITEGGPYAAVVIVQSIQNLLFVRPVTQACIQNGYKWGMAHLRQAVWAIKEAGRVGSSFSFYPSLSFPSFCEVARKVRSTNRFGALSPRCMGY